MSQVATLTHDRPDTEIKWSPASYLNVLAESGLNFLSMTLTEALIFPGDEGYEATAQTLNLRYANKRPSAIARCTSPEDVAQCIVWCADFHFPFAIKSGGHSYAGYSRTNGLLIDMSRMNDCLYDTGTGVIRVSGGAVIQDVLRTLEPHGRAITHGRCSTVGMASMIMGGGSGFNMRLNGMGCDKLVALDLITNEGDMRRVTAESDPELFWACRGGGAGQFGVTTALEIQTLPVSMVTVFNLEWHTAPVEVLHEVMTLLNDASNAYGSRVALARRSADQPVVATCLGQFHGDAELDFPHFRQRGTVCRSTGR